MVTWDYVVVHTIVEITARSYTGHWHLCQGCEKEYETLLQERCAIVFILRSLRLILELE